MAQGTKSCSGLASSPQTTCSLDGCSSRKAVYLKRKGRKKKTNQNSLTGAKGKDFRALKLMSKALISGAVPPRLDLQPVCPPGWGAPAFKSWLRQLGTQLDRGCPSVHPSHSFSLLLCLSAYTRRCKEKRIAAPVPAASLGAHTESMSTNPGEQDPDPHPAPATGLSHAPAEAILQSALAGSHFFIFREGG